MPITTQPTPETPIQTLPEGDYKVPAHILGGMGPYGSSAQPEVDYTGTLTGSSYSANQMFGLSGNEVEQNGKLKAQAEMIDEMEGKLNEQTEMINEMQDKLYEQDMTLGYLDAYIEDLKKKMEEQEEMLEDQKRVVDEQNGKIKKLDKKVKSRFRVGLVRKGKNPFGLRRRVRK